MNKCINLTRKIITLLQLVDVPEMEYYASQGQGEVCVQGANVFKGYFKEPEKTREVIDQDGWHHTGDVGKWLQVRWKSFMLLYIFLLRVDLNNK